MSNSIPEAYKARVELTQNLAQKIHDLATGATLEDAEKELIDAVSLFEKRMADNESLVLAVLSRGAKACLSLPNTLNGLLGHFDEVNPPALPAPTEEDGKKKGRGKKTP